MGNWERRNNAEFELFELWAIRTCLERIADALDRAFPRPEQSPERKAGF